MMFSSLNYRKFSVLNKKYLMVWVSILAQCSAALDSSTSWHCIPLLYNQHSYSQCMLIPFIFLQWFLHLFPAARSAEI